MKKNTDRILKHALSPVEEPDARLNDKIIYRAEEMERMANRKKYRIPAAVLAACFTLVIGSTAVFAAWKYLSPKQVALENEDRKLAEAFTGEDAVLVNETQEFDGYRVTLLGAVAGKNISEYLSMDGQGNVKDDMFYAAVAIEHTDGTPMPDTSDDAYGEESFYVSPYIKGLNPVRYSIMSMGGGYSEFVQEGIQYRLVEMDNIEIFADRGIYIGVSSGTFYDANAYRYDAATGEIGRNEDYEGLNALFDLPLNPAKADPEAAEHYLEELEASWKAPDEELPQDVLDMDVEAWMELVEDAAKNGDISQYADIIESTVQTVTPDKDGVLHYSWELESGAGGSGVDTMENLFPQNESGILKTLSYSYSDGLEDVKVATMFLNEDGTVTFAVYVPKNKSTFGIK